MLKFTGNSKPVLVLLVLALIAFMAFLWLSDAEADQGFSAGLGRAAVGSEFCTTSLLLTQELSDRRWMGTLWTHGDGQCRGETMRANIGVGVLRTANLYRWSLGFGAALQEHGDMATGPAAIDEQYPRTADRTQLCAQILIRRRVGDRFVVDFLHCSTGGSTQYNPGRNMLLFGVRL